MNPEGEIELGGGLGNEYAGGGARRTDRAPRLCPVRRGERPRPDPHAVPRHRGEHRRDGPDDRRVAGPPPAPRAAGPGVEDGTEDRGELERFTLAWPTPPAGPRGETPLPP